MHRLLTIVLMSSAALLAAGSEDAIRQGDQKWASSIKARDTAALDGLFAPGLIYAHATGAVQNKQEYIDRIKSGKQRYDSVTIESTKVVMYGDSAVSHSVVRTIGVNDAGPFNDHVMMMHFWVKQGGKWLLAAHQTTKIP